MKPLRSLTHLLAGRRRVRQEYGVRMMYTEMGVYVQAPTDPRQRWVADQVDLCEAPGVSSSVGYSATR